MYMILLYGVLIILVSLWMIINPESWVRKAVVYCQKPYMHPVEIAICLGFGISFIVFGENVGFPWVIRSFGFVLAAVGVGLMLTPPAYHQRYGIWSIEKMGKYFRPAGIFSLLFGAGLIYAALNPGMSIP